MKIGRPAIAVLLGLAALALLFAPPLIFRHQPEIESLRYSLSADVTQGLGATLLIMYLWTSGTLFVERKRLSVALLLVILIPLSFATVLGIFDNYQTAHAPRDPNHQIIDDHF